MEINSRNKRAPITPLCWSVKDLAQMLGLGERTIWRWVDEGKIPAPRKFGGRRLWLVTEIQAWVKSRPKAS